MNTFHNSRSRPRSIKFARTNGVSKNVATCQKKKKKGDNQNFKRQIADATAIGIAQSRQRSGHLFTRPGYRPSKKGTTLTLRPRRQRGGDRNRSALTDNDRQSKLNGAYVTRLAHDNSKTTTTIFECRRPPPRGERCYLYSYGNVRGPRGTRHKFRANDAHRKLVVVVIVLLRSFDSYGQFVLVAGFKSQS